VALVTCQHSLLDWPVLMFCGLATKVTTCGIPPVLTVTVTGAVTVVPLAAVAVRV